MRKLAVALFWLSVLVAVVFALLPQPPMLPGDPSDKALHVLAFSVMAGLAAAAYPEKTTWQLLAWLCALGGGIELVQAIPSLNRDADLLDWIADTAAAGLVLVLVHPLAKHFAKG